MKDTEKYLQDCKFPSSLQRNQIVTSRFIRNNATIYTVRWPIQMDAGTCPNTGVQRFMMHFLTFLERGQQGLEHSDDVIILMQYTH